MSRVVLVHGFTQTRSSWARVAAALSTEHDVVTVDLPGHGGAPVDDLRGAAARVAEECGRAAYVGYSMGGRLCLQLALDHPAAVEGLVLLGATAGIDDPLARAQRQAHDDALAASLERDGQLDSFLERWLDQPMFAGLPSDAADVAARRANDPRGLAGALRLAGTGAQEPSWARLGELREHGIPTLLLTGERDEKFAALARRMADGIGPSARVALITGAGHAAHLEAPDAFVALVAPFLAGRVP